MLFAWGLEDAYVCHNSLISIVQTGRCLWWFYVSMGRFKASPTSYSSGNSFHYIPEVLQNEHSTGIWSICKFTWQIFVCFRFCVHFVENYCIRFLILKNMNECHGLSMITSLTRQSSINSPKGQLQIKPCNCYQSPCSNNIHVTHIHTFVAHFLFILITTSTSHLF